MLTFNGGEGTVQSTYGSSGTAVLSFSSLAARPTGATENFVVSGGALATNLISLTSTTNAPLNTSGSNNQGVFGDFPGTTGAYARYDTTNNTFRAVIYGTDNNAVAQVTTASGNFSDLGVNDATKDVQYRSQSSVSSTSTGGNTTNSTSLTVTDASQFRVGQALSGSGTQLSNNWITAITGNTLTLANPASVTNATTIRAYNSVTAQTSASLNTLNLISGASGGASLTLGSGQTLSVNGILTSNVQTGHANVLSGGTAITTTTTNAELVIRTTGPNTNVTVIDTPIQANGTNALTKSGTGQLILDGANTYTGGTNIDAGILTANNANALGTSGNITFYGGTFISGDNTPTGGTLQYTTASGGQDWSSRFKNSPGAIVLDTNGQNVALANSIDSSNTGGLVVSNTSTTATGSLTLSGNNTFSGGVTLLGGNTSGLQLQETLNINNNSALGTGTFTIALPSSGSGAPKIDNTSGSVKTISNDVNMQTSFTFGSASGTSNLTMTGAVTMPGSISVTVTAAATTLEIDGAIGQTNANRVLTKLGAGTLLLANANTYGGAGANTVITAGTLQLGDGTSGHDGSVVNGITDNAALVFNVFGSKTAGAITGSGTVTKSGAGTEILAAANTYTGVTTISAGTLQLDSLLQSTTGSLANTAITINPIASGANPTLAVIPGAAKTYNAGTITSGSAGATLNIQNGTTLSPVAAAFTMADDAVETFSLRQQVSFAGTGLTIGAASGAGYVKPTLTFDIGGASLTDIDLFSIVKGGGGGTVSVGTGGGQLFFNALTSSSFLTLGDYTFMTAGGGLGSNFTLGTNTLVVGSNTYNLSLANSTSTAEILTISASSETTLVPEPSTLLLLGVGSICLAGYALRRKYHRG